MDLPANEFIVECVSYVVLQIHTGGQSQPSPVCIPAVRGRPPELCGNEARPTGNQNGSSASVPQVQRRGLLRDQGRRNTRDNKLS